MVSENLTNKKTILIVEDDLKIINFITEFVSDRFSVIVKSFGEDAIRFISKCGERDVDLAITDFKLPDISGLEVLKKIKELKSSLPIIVMTGYGDEDIAIKAFKYGARDYIKKPFESNKLIKTIDFCLSLKSIDKDLPRRVLINETDDSAARLICSMKPYDYMHKLERALKYIDDNYSFKLSIEKVAEKACMSKSHFSRIFKKIVGRTYQDYLNKIRIDKAKIMILGQNLTITEIAYSVGYFDLTHFERIFKKIVGRTPTQFLKENSN